jgi:hypothetical protein
MNDIYNDGMPIEALNKKYFQEVPIYRATKYFISLQILQPLSVIWELLRYLEGADPKGFKFYILSPVLFERIPLEYHISQPKIIFNFFLVKGLLEFLLTVMCFAHHLLSSLLYFYQLMNSPNYVMRISLVVLEEFLYRESKLRRKNCFSPIYHLEKRDAQGPFGFLSIGPKIKFDL